MTSCSEKRMLAVMDPRPDRAAAAIDDRGAPGIVVTASGGHDAAMEDLFDGAPCEECEEISGRVAKISLGQDDEIWVDDDGNLVAPPEGGRRPSHRTAVLLGLPASAVLGAVIGEVGLRGASVFAAVLALIFAAACVLGAAAWVLIKHCFSRETVDVPIADARLIDSMRRAGALPAGEEEVGMVARTLSEIRASRQPRRP